MPTPAELFAKLQENIKTDTAFLGSIKSEKDVEKLVADKLNIGAELSTINRQFAVAMFQLGKATKGRNTEVVVDNVYRAFRKRVEAADASRAVQKESTVVTMVSYYSSYIKLGKAPWDADFAFAWILQNVGISYSKRGKFIKAVAALTAAPTAEELQTLLDGPDYTTVRGADKETESLYKSVAALGKTFPDFKVEGSAKRRAWAAALKAMKNLETVCQTEGDDDLADIMAEAA